MTIATTNPTTGETLKKFTPDSDALIEQKLQKAADAFQKWRGTSFAERAQRLNKAAALLEERKDALGRLMTLEMGKLRKAAVAEIEKCANGCRYYAENAERHLAPEEVETDAKRSQKRFQPLGPVLAVMKAKDFNDAMRIANNIPFGLSASVQTSNLSRVFEFIYGCEAGLLTINLPSAGVEYQLPFGGTKDSSFGPKEQGPAALDFYTDYKTVYLKY